MTERAELIALLGGWQSLYALLPTSLQQKVASLDFRTRMILEQEA